ncbi:hypothetical protein JTE90_022207 [Oedothorax gibbosus]|uniref:Uncharacterized protein n=1 Tax=Oedothorax gibbosus TaxID=931172 RepID=A0AAV6VNQ7_9ARAC|nr:hypothetical protein JTE90_022207 [Oedothorax gibbosus]
MVLRSDLLRMGRRKSGDGQRQEHPSSASSRIPKFTFDPEKCFDESRCHGDRNGVHLRTAAVGDRLYGFRRVPTPMPRVLTPGGQIGRVIPYNHFPNSSGLVRPSKIVQILPPLKPSTPNFNDPIHYFNRWMPSISHATMGRTTALFAYIPLPYFSKWGRKHIIVLKTPIGGWGRRTKAELIVPSEKTYCLSAPIVCAAMQGPSEPLVQGLPTV